MLFLFSILFFHSVFAWTIDLSNPPIRCDQLFIESACIAEYARCKWVNPTICDKNNNCRVARYGCKPITWCGYYGNRANRRFFCKRDKHCKWVKNKRCTNLKKHTLEANPWDKSNLCWFAAFNGKCDDLAFPNSTSNWCMRGHDYSDCLMIHGYDFANWITDAEYD